MIVSLTLWGSAVIMQRKDFFGVRACLALLGAGTLIVAVAFALTLRKQPAPPKTDESDIAEFVGNEACRPCHATEFDAFHDTYHKRSLRPVTRAALGEQNPPAGKINDTQYAFIEQGDQFFFEVNPPSQPDKHQLWPLDLIFGSGKFGMSFVSLLEGKNVVEMKMSYFPEGRRWGITPGQKMEDPAAAGNLGNLEQSRKCIGCHSIAVSKNAFKPRDEFFGAGCESCHGAGRAHIKAVESGEADKRMTKFQAGKARDLNVMCGKCHLTEKDIPPASALAKMTNRFQPYGLMKSKCFLEGGEKISCSTCHNPHMNASRDVNFYNKACLSCHAPAAKPSATVAPGKICPVNATTNCTSCHMPKRDLIGDMNMTSGVMFSDHRIAVYNGR